MIYTKRVRIMSISLGPKPILEENEHKRGSPSEWLTSLSCIIQFHTPLPSERIPISVGNIADAPVVPNTPARPENLIVVKPTEIVSKIKHDIKANAIRLIHSQAHIESYAIDLSWDIFARFCQLDKTVPVTKDLVSSDENTTLDPTTLAENQTMRTFLPEGETLPIEFFEDWLQVAEDEARHFMSWHDRLLELDSFYGALPTHNSLWESADTTKHSILARLAIVHMVHEAHGLDCGDRLVNQLIGAKDPVSASLLRSIQVEEIRHVRAGVRWFKYVCERAGIEPIARFHEVVRSNFRGALRPPFAVKERAEAGMTEEWYLPLAVKIERPKGQLLPHKAAQEAREAKAKEAKARGLAKAAEDAARRAEEDKQSVKKMKVDGCASSEPVQQDVQNESIDTSAATSTNDATLTN